MPDASATIAIAPGDTRFLGMDMVCSSSREGWQSARSSDAWNEVSANSADRQSETFQPEAAARSDGEPTLLCKG
jgi:hypothetical protein